jgi:hypothetical protein
LIIFDDLAELIAVEVDLEVIPLRLGAGPPPRAAVAR